MRPLIAASRRPGLHVAIGQSEEFGGSKSNTALDSLNGSTHEGSEVVARWTMSRSFRFFPSPGLQRLGGYAYNPLMDTNQNPTGTKALSANMVAALARVAAGETTEKDFRTMSALARRGLVEMVMVDRARWIRGWVLTDAGREATR